MILVNAKLATLDGDSGYGMMPEGAVAIADGRVAWVGKTNDIPDCYSGLPRQDLQGRLVTPGLIDCHTHLVHAGDRVREFEMRLEGASYADVMRSGGGIHATVAATRAATEGELLASALERVDCLLAEGVTTIEVKSGYGLDIETELKMLRVARRIASKRPIRVHASFLGAHAVDPAYEGCGDDYLTEVCLPALEQAAAEGLVDAVDGFCEEIAFSPQQIDCLFQQATRLGLRVKLHADQLTNSGGAELAAKHSALSADHLEYATEQGARAMGRAGTVAVLLPGAFYTLRERQLPPVDHFRANNTLMAVGTDMNPGSSPLRSLLLAMNMACTLFRLTPAEALRGTTVNAARALGIEGVGRIAPGYQADLAVWDVENPAELSYRIGGASLLHARLFAGEVTC